MKKGTELLIVIPAFKERVVFQDDLVKNLAGRSLLERAIDRAKSVETLSQRVVLFTDSEEVSLIGERNNVPSICQSFGEYSVSESVKNVLSSVPNAGKEITSILVLSPYAPLITKVELRNAFEKFVSLGVDVLKSVRHEKQHLFKEISQTIDELLLDTQGQKVVLNSQAFTFFKYELLARDRSDTTYIAPWVIPENMVEIETLQDWWVSEKLLQRKRIVFRVIGNKEVGMGHIYRSLSIAHELHDHETLFVCDSESYEVVNELAGYDYWLDVAPQKAMTERIASLKPDLVINDMLDTTAEYIRALKRTGIAVVNFEDLGPGATLADLTINELYDKPAFPGSRILWGHDYFFVREEFDKATPHQILKKNVERILLTFGGTDQHNLTREIYQAIKELCRAYGVHIHIVTGPGYQGYEALAEEVKKNEGASITHATGVISSIMERTQLAITSNGRTVYELAHMNIPSIVIPQNARECTHSFAREETGFIPVSPYQAGVSEDQICVALEKLLNESNYRNMLIRNMEPYSFRANKKRVLDEILRLIKVV